MGKQNRTMAESNYISATKTDAWKARIARVVIVGGGFGGLAAAKALRRAPVKVILIDRTNHMDHTAKFSEFFTSPVGRGRVACDPGKGCLSQR